MGFVEQQEPGTAGQSHGQARPALLAGGEAPEGHAGQPGQAQLFQDGVGVGRAAASRPDPETEVLPDGEVVVGAGGVTDEGQLGPDGVTIGRQIVPQDDRPTGGERKEAGDEAQQRGLTSAVRARQQHHLPLVDVEIDPGQRRIPAEQADGGPQVDGGNAQIDSICVKDHRGVHLSVRRAAGSLG